MITSLRISVLTLAIAFAPFGSIRADNSALWGAKGEAWSPASRLPDYSFAGYHCGESALPEYPVTVKVRDFGAKGDGVTDDTEALRKAVVAAKSGAIFLSAGRYVITDFIDLDKSGVVLRGEGPDKTVLYFPQPLSTKHPMPTQNSGGTPTQAWSWSGGFLRISGKRPVVMMMKASLATDAKRGEKTVILATSAPFKAGDWVALHQADPGDMSFVKYLYAGDPGAIKNFPKNHPCRFPLRIVSVEGKNVTFDRALPLDFRTAWGAGLETFAPTITETGVEHLSFEFPVTPYKGHFHEAGFNPVAISGAAHCWVRDVRFVNADSGPMVGADFCTLTGLEWVSERPASKAGQTGHHGMILGGTQNLVSDFKIHTEFVHDLTVSSGSYFNVFSNGSAVDLAMDHHERAPTGNLFTDIDLGEGSRPFLCGGGSALGKNCASYATFWNLRSKKTVPFPAPAFGPKLINVVGVKAAGKPVTSPTGEWYEPTAPEKLEPQDLHTAQLAKRMGK